MLIGSDKIKVYLVEMFMRSEKIMVCLVEMFVGSAKIMVCLVEMFAGSAKYFEIKRCSRQGVVEIERVHCNCKQIFIVLLFYQGGWSKMRLIYNTSTVDSISNNRYLELCLNSNNLSSFLVIQDLIKAKNSWYFESHYLKLLHMSNNFFGPLSSFFSLSQTFPKISKVFQFFLSNQSFFNSRWYNCCNFAGKNE